jgi:hypothetical protein
MSNRGVIRVDRRLLSTLLMLPEGYEVKRYGTEYLTDELVFGVEGPDIPEVPEGDLLPAIQLIEHTMVDDDGVVWKRREIQGITDYRNRCFIITHDSQTIS